MTKYEWLLRQFEVLSKGRDDYWPEGRKGLTELFTARGEKITRAEFWKEFNRCFNDSIGTFGPSNDAINAADYFAESADFSLVWDTAPLVTFPRISNEVLIETLEASEDFVRIGGTPDWIQSPDTPICKRCERDMALLAQISSLPSDVRDSNRDLKDIDFADSGRIYLFCCKDDGQFALRHQYY